MSDEYKVAVGIPKHHSLKLKDSDFKGSRKGQDTDVYIYDELDENGELVRTLEITDSMSIYPPFKRSITWAEYK